MSSKTPRSVTAGPYGFKGGIPVESANGRRYEVRNRVTLCRCGASDSKPFLQWQSRKYEISGWHSERIVGHMEGKPFPSLSAFSVAVDTRPPHPEESTDCNVLAHTNCGKKVVESPVTKWRTGLEPSMK